MWLTPDMARSTASRVQLSTSVTFWIRIIGCALFLLAVVGHRTTATAAIVVGPGATAQLWTGSLIPTVSLDQTGVMPPEVTAIFQWNNSIQQFNFWFRGFPPSFQTLTPGLVPGGFYFFQATGSAVVSVPNEGSYVLPPAGPPPGNAFQSVPGATGQLWLGTEHKLDSLDALLPTSVTAVQAWNNTTQSFAFWFRGFPPTFHTLTGGLQRGNYYFFSTSTSQSITMQFNGHLNNRRWFDDRVLHHGGDYGAWMTLTGHRQFLCSGCQDVWSSPTWEGLVSWNSLGTTVGIYDLPPDENNRVHSIVTDRFYYAFGNTYDTLNALGITYVRMSPIDVVINAIVLVDNDSHVGQFGSVFQRQATTAHELGHAVGLEHMGHVSLNQGNGLCGELYAPASIMDYDCSELEILNGPTQWDRCALHHAYFDPAFGFSGCPS